MIVLVRSNNSGLTIKWQCWEIQITDDDNSPPWLFAAK
jgi:hypothetical protein